MSSDNTQDNLENYKGIHYDNQEKEILYDYGAHFSFEEICKKLSILLNQQKHEGKFQLVFKNLRFYKFFLLNLEF